MARPKMYKNLKISERMILFITKELNFVEIDSKNKYRMFERPGKTKSGEYIIQYLFIGKNGAVRAHSKKNAAESFSKTEQFAKALAQYEINNNLMEVANETI
jgi:hypothetical protein